MRNYKQLSLTLLIASCGMVFGYATTAYAAIASINPAPGYTITFDGNDGRFAGTLVPTNLALIPGNTSFGSSQYPAAAHQISHINDGLYGNDNSWLSFLGPPTADPDPRIGVGLVQPFPLTGIAWSRANNSSHPDRTVGTYTLQYTTDAAPSLGGAWNTIGTVTYDASAGDGVPGGTFDNWLRHEYTISQGGNPIMATGFRIAINDPQIAIDEMELYYDDPAISATAPTAWLKEQGAVLSGASVTRWGDRSGNDNDATPGVSPTYALNSIYDMPALNFASAGTQHLNLPSTVNLGIARTTDIDDNVITTGDYEIYVVAQSADAAIQFLHGAGNLGGAGSFELHLNGSAGARFIPSTSATNFVDIGQAGDYTDGRPHLYHVRVDSDNGYIAVNGVQSSSTTTGAYSTVDEPLTLGVRGNGSLPFNGAMGEVLVFNKVLTPGERLQVEHSLQDKWEFVYKRETGGTMDVGTNIALATNGGVAFAKDVLPGYAAHTINHLNDGNYGNDFSWIGNSAPTFAGIAFDNAAYIDQIAFGRDNTGAVVDRFTGTYILQYTTVDNPDASTLDGDWITLATLRYLGTTMPDSPSLRHLWDIPTTLATGIRIITDGGIAIDEIEVYGVLVPEPSGLVLAGLGAIGLAAMRRRRK